VDHAGHSDCSAVSGFEANAGFPDDLTATVAGGTHPVEIHVTIDVR